MEASEMSSMTETATGDAGKKEEDDSRRKAVLGAICCGIVLALLLAAAAASAMNTDEDHDETKDDNADHRYAIGTKGGGNVEGKVTIKGDDITAPTTAMTIKEPEASTAMTVKAPTEPAETTTTEEPMPDKPRTGLFCVAGATRLDFYPVPEEVVLKMCKRIIARVYWQSGLEGPQIYFDLFFEKYDIQTPAYNKHTEQLYWAWSYYTVSRYQDGNFFARFDMRTTPVHTARYGLTMYTLKNALETNHIQQFVEVLGDIPAEKMALVIDASDPETNLIKGMDTSKFDRIGYIIVTQDTYRCHFETGFWEYAPYKTFVKALNRAVKQPIAISATGAFITLESFNETGKNECEDSELNYRDWVLCASDKKLDQFHDLKHARIRCRETWLGFETTAWLKALVDFAKSTKINCALYNIEQRFYIEEWITRDSTVMTEC